MPDNVQRLIEMMLRCVGDKTFHELSMPSMVCMLLGFDPALNISTMIMRPPQQGQGCGRTLVSSADAGSGVSGSFC